MRIRERVTQLEETLGFSPSGPELPVIVAIWEQRPGLDRVDPQFVECHGKTFSRQPGETIDGLIDRVTRLERKAGFCLIIWIDEGEDQCQNTSLQEKQPN
jgi:hypothetical protein